MTTKIIRTLAGLVLYAGDAVALYETHALTQSGSEDKAANFYNCVLEEVASLPADFQGGYYTYINGVWAKTAAGTAALAAQLADLKGRKILEINAARLAANFTTFAHAGKTFACDTLSRSDIDGTNGIISLTGDFPLGWPGGWKAVDNSYIAINTQEQWAAFYLSMCATGAANFAHAQALKAALSSATTPEQVAAINW